MTPPFCGLPPFSSFSWGDFIGGGQEAEKEIKGQSPDPLGSVLPPAKASWKESPQDPALELSIPRRSSHASSIFFWDIVWQETGARHLGTSAQMCARSTANLSSQSHPYRARPAPLIPHYLSQAHSTFTARGAFTRSHSPPPGVQTREPGGTRGLGCARILQGKRFEPGGAAESQRVGLGRVNRCHDKQSRAQRKGEQAGAGLGRPRASPGGRGLAARPAPPLGVAPPNWPIGRGYTVRPTLTLGVAPRCHRLAPPLGVATSAGRLRPEA